MTLTNRKNFLIPLICYINITGVGVGAANATEPSSTNQALTATPQGCVALRQGQVCYQETTFKWTQETLGNYCLLELPTQHKVKCWSQTKSAEISIDFQSDKSMTYVLRKQDQDINLSSVTFTVSWVYRSSKRPRSSWKLF